MARRFIAPYGLKQLRSKQREIPVNKIVVRGGHRKEIGVKRGRPTAANPDITGSSQRKHAFNLEGAGAAVFKNMGISGTGRERYLVNQSQHIVFEIDGAAFGRTPGLSSQCGERIVQCLDDNRVGGLRLGSIGILAPGVIGAFSSSLP